MGNADQATDLVPNVPSATSYRNVRTVHYGFMASPWSDEMVCECEHCEGNISGDGQSNQIDLAILLADWGYGTGL